MIPEYRYIVKLKPNRLMDLHLNRVFKEIHTTIGRENMTCQILSVGCMFGSHALQCCEGERADSVTSIILVCLRLGQSRGLCYFQPPDTTVLEGR